MITLLTAWLLAQATIYSWTDKKGVEHFTDDLSTIPKGVKVRTTEGAVVSRIESDVVVNKPVVTQQAKPAPDTSLASEQQWRSLFRAAYRRVSDLEEDIERDRKQVEEVNGMPIRAGFTCAQGWWGSAGYGSTLMVNGGGLSASTGPTITTLPTVAPCYYSLNPEYERVRERLASNRRELLRAKADLDELERRASFAAVPREWRH
ncbi:MAG: hypothetical protein DI536_28810 [Archangium gephyra]|uniref:DUF4124 domain-containing protein n=1 Tax=Archangium gephyra TaxID=48 RepID=A0A2W5SVU3_9BACT|nr:MAG: hypothetical protein DI536_28810 [Archangium gephyra]